MNDIFFSIGIIALSAAVLVQWSLNRILMTKIHQLKYKIDELNKPPF